MRIFATEHSGELCSRVRVFGCAKPLCYDHLRASKRFAVVRQHAPSLVRAGRQQEASSLEESSSGRAGTSSPNQEEVVSSSVEPAANSKLPHGLVCALALGGAAITGYISVERLRGGSVACPASGSCETILSSGYATVFGIPLSLLGFAAYSTVAGLAAWQAIRQQKHGVSQSGNKSVLAGGTLLATTSSNLLYILFTQFPGQSCTWCLASASLSFAILIAACSGFTPRRELSKLSLPGGLSAAGLSLFLALAWNGVEAPQAMANINIPYQATTVRYSSSPRAIDVAKRLREAGAKMYGAFWCSHCQEQKVSFGKEAQADLPYVECFPDGYRTGVQMAAECKAANLQGFPLWIINGRRYEGEQTLADLETALKQPSS